jgi:hypothetical protein
MPQVGLELTLVAKGGYRFRSNISPPNEHMGEVTLTQSSTTNKCAHGVLMILTGDMAQITYCCDEVYAS